MMTVILIAIVASKGRWGRCGVLYEYSMRVSGTSIFARVSLTTSFYKHSRPNDLAANFYIFIDFSPLLKMKDRVASLLRALTVPLSEEPTLSTEEIPLA